MSFFLLLLKVGNLKDYQVIYCLPSFNCFNLHCDLRCFLPILHIRMFSLSFVSFIIIFYLEQHFFSYLYQHFHYYSHFYSNSHLILTDHLTPTMFYYFLSTTSALFLLPALYFSSLASLSSFSAHLQNP